MTSNQQTTDIVIVGGGLAGLSMAAALSSLPLNITVIEFASSPLAEHSNSDKDSPESGNAESSYSPSFDDRALALSVASIKILNNIGVFDQADIDSCTPIEHIHVSDRGHMGMLRMAASEVDEAYLGKVIPAPLLGQKLSQFISNKGYTAKISVLDQSQVTHIKHKADKAIVQISSDENDHVRERTIDCQAVILADGGRSNMAEKIGLPAIKTDYEQVGILANVVISKNHQNIAYERFTDTGPLALLPLRSNEFKLVWTVEPSEQEALLAMTDEVFLSSLQQRFGQRAGYFEKVSRRVAYPMIANERAQIVSGRVALIGNAAHSLHPIAGQGFNLGLRDVACLAEVLAGQLAQQQDLGDAQALMSYQSARQDDIKRTATFTDQLVKKFSTNAKPIAILRTVGLLALDMQTMLKRQLMRKLMGVSGQQFKLLKGQALLDEKLCKEMNKELSDVQGEEQNEKVQAS